MAEVVDPSRVLFDTEWGGSPLQQLERALSSDWEGMLPSKGHAGYLPAFQCFGQMGQATDLLFKSRYLSGTPLIEAPPHGGSTTQHVMSRTEHICTC
jgi:hypothetical protein